MKFQRQTKPAVATVLILTIFSSHSATIMSASCSEPEGVRYDRIAGKTKRDDDKFSGVNPQFILSDSNPSKLTVIWPDSRNLGASAKQQAHEAMIIDSSESMVSAVALYEQRVNLYTLFPKQGVAFMSTHKQIPIQGGIPSGSLFKLECKFELN